MYGSEITGLFKTSSAACRKENEYLLQQIYINDFIILNTLNIFWV
jgi:hypothetical protein